MDELDARVRSLEAERMRPVPPPPGPVTQVGAVVLAELCRELGEESGVVALDDPEDGPLGEVRMYQPSDLGWPDPLGGRPADRRAEGLTTVLGGVPGAPVRPSVLDEIGPHVVAHGPSVARPDG